MTKELGDRDVLGNDGPFDLSSGGLSSEGTSCPVKACPVKAVGPKAGCNPGDTRATQWRIPFWVQSHGCLLHSSGEDDKEGREEKGMRVTV